MEAATTASATATMKAVNFPTASTISRATVSATLASPWPQNKLKMLTLYAPNLNTRLSLTRCSTKPNTDTDNETDQNSTFESNPDQKTQNPSKPILSNEPIPSSSLSRGLVFDLGNAESWDCKEIGSPVVKRFLSDEEERWYMWYHGVSNENPDSDSIGLAVSSNGVHWERGLAMSQDGRHWARIEGEHHSGALFDVGSEREWDSLFISSPKVVFHGNGDLRMYYHSYDVQNGEFCIGMARSRDGMKWLKLGKIMGRGKSGSFDELGVKNPCVVKNKKDGNYVMAFEGVNEDGKGSIGLAISSDGLKDWRRVQDEAVMKQGMDDEWDCEGIGSPCLVEMDGDSDEWRLYYRGIGNGGRSGIGMAISDGSDLTKFRRWTGFHV
ncbi:hypothetical protein CCACVL1_06557 [Corchorus capsularis]|uniref:Glycosyl hydrolase, five-bladed beta-propellor domain-containing protein n=1 Tax=Corchorus capsularis TaxID=210143 RepID=A0A1R3JEL6_COCAP|nr:hypothetical protein CCACVL1_06557 [Corchorus capsularis]